MTESSTETEGTESQEDTGQQSEGSQDETEGQQTESDFDSLPDVTKAEIKQLRRENQRLRKAAKGIQGSTDSPSSAETVLAKLAESLGVEMGVGAPKGKAKATDDGTADELRLAKVELALYRVAGAAGADLDALLATRSLIREIDDLDPSDADFEKNLKDVIKAALGQNPNLRTKKTPGRSGGDMNGGKGSGQREFTSPQERLAAAYAANSGN
jgi:hypothetical protein